MMRARTRPAERGASMVEFALCIVLVLTLTFGIMEFARALNAYHFVSNAAHDATRWAMVRGSACTAPMTHCDAAQADIENYVKGLDPVVDLAALGINPAALTAAATWPDLGTTPRNSPGKRVRVQVQYNFSFSIPFVPSRTLRMTSTSQMVISQ